MNHFNDAQVSMPTDSCGGNSFDNRSEPRFCNRQISLVNSKFHFKKPMFSERNSYPVISLSGNRSRFSVSNKSELCRLFQRGKCHFGKICRYAHNMSEIRKLGIKTDAMEEYLDGDSQRNYMGRVKECYFSSSGIDCPYGENCLYLHKCDQNVRGDVGSESCAINVVNERSDRSGSDQIVCKSLVACQKYSKLALFKSKLCMKWERFGSCPYGMKCTYAHGKAELQKSGYSSELEQDHTSRSVHDVQPNNAASCQLGIKTANKPKMEGKRAFMKLKSWNIEKISEIYADWVEMSENPMFH